jgi:undecaprenyl-diphosphatase
LHRVLEAIVLGLIQGLTEFLPVSSSGHLVIVPYLLSWEQPTITFDVAVHFGTVLAVIGYFAGDLWWLGTRSLGIGGNEADAKRARLTITLLALASVPAAAAGFLLEEQFEAAFDDPRVAAAMLLVTGGLLWGAEYVRRQRAARIEGVPAAKIPPAVDHGRDEGTTTFMDAAIIGVAQAAAILPGISRSGATIVAGMVRGLSREGATRFSFLLSIPIILGATAFKLGDFLAPDKPESVFSDVEILAGTFAAAVSGFLALRFMLRLVVNEDLLGFARYVVLLGILTFVGYAWLGPPSL